MENASFPSRADWYSVGCSLHEAATNDNGLDGEDLAICAYAAAYAALWAMMPSPWEGKVPPKGELLAAAADNLRRAAIRLWADQLHDAR